MAHVSYAGDPSHPDFHAPRHHLLNRALREHSEADRLADLLRERTVDGERAWQVAYDEAAYADEAGPWLTWTLRPTRFDDEREPITIGGIPVARLERLERDYIARATEHDAPDVS